MFDNKYPYTDFSQLNLDWFLNKFKDLLAEQQRVSGLVQDLDETVQQFTTFVTNYFDDLDVQQEINNKLDAMVADGTLSALIAPLVGDDIQDSVTEWLNENVDPVGSAVVVDTTLSIAGAAADAEVTGKEIKNVSDAADSIKTGLIIFTEADWEQGTISTSSGGNTTSTYRIRLKNRYKAEKNFSISNPTGYTLAIFRYQDDGTFIDSTGFPADDTPTVYNITKDENVNIVFSKYPTATTNTSDYIKINYYNMTKCDMMISDINDEIVNIKNDLYVNIFTESDFEQGAISTSSGDNSSSTYRIRLKSKFKAPFDFDILNSPGYTIAVFRYNPDGSFIDSTGYPANDDPTKITIHKNEYVNIVISEYPIATTVTSEYTGMICHVTQAEVLDYMAALKSYDVGLALTKDGAEFAENENLTFFSHAYYVGADKTYTTINAALTQWAVDGYPAAVVYIANGEYTETVYVEDHTIAFIGESRDGTIVRTTQGNYTYPPFKIHHGNVLIANLTAIADHSDNPSFVYNPNANMAYAIHVDGGSVGGIVHIKNVKAVSHQCAAFGMGTIPNSLIRLEDVEAYSYVPSNAGASLNAGCILCHLASPTLYPDPGDEGIEFINVKAYGDNTPNVIKLSQQDSTNTLYIKAINLMTVSGAGYSQTAMIKMPAFYDLDDDSIGNSSPLFNA